MNMRLLLLSLFLFVSVADQAQINQGVISAKLVVKKAHKGKLISVAADVAYSTSERRMVANYTSPDKFIMFVNEKGEVKVYYPTKNQVILNQNNLFSSNSDVFYFFLTQNEQDLGLRSMGYQLISSNSKGAITETRWKAPEQMQGKVSEVELVYENFLPIYVAYFGPKKGITNKTFYANYQTVDNVMIPTRITEYVYLSAKDSIVSRKDYLDVKTGKNASRSLLDFKIPANAKVAK